MKLLSAVVFAAFLVLNAEAAKPKRFQFGSLISSSEKDGILLEHAGNVTEYEKSGNATSTMLAKHIIIGVDPTRYRVTMATRAIPTNWTGDYSKLVRSRGCVNTKFLPVEGLASTEKIPENSLIIIANELKCELVTAEVCQKLHEKHVKLGFLKRFSVLDDKCRKTLVDNEVQFVENLELPSEIDLLSMVKSTKPYYAFKNMFVPLKSATITYGGGSEIEKKTLVNLADIVLFEGDDKLSKFCSEMGRNLALFGQKLISETFPILHGFEMPHFVSRVVENETEYWLQFSGQTGTNLVAPYRFDKSKANIANLNENLFFSPCACVSVPCGNSSNFKITREDLEQWEKEKNVKIPENSVILLKTGYWSKWETPSEYVKDYPGLDVEAAKWLVEERKAVGIAIDSLSLDDFSLSSVNKWPTHGYLAEKNIPAMLNLRFERVEQFPEVGSRCVFSYLRIQGGTSSPLMIFGLPGYDSFEVAEKVDEEKEMPVESKKIEEERAGKGEEKEVELAERWQFGRVIRHLSDECACTLREVSLDVFKSVETSERQKMTFTETNLIVDPSINTVTTVSQPSDRPVVMTEGCIETLFIKTTDLKTLKKKLQDVVKENMLIIFLTTDLLKLHDMDLIKAAAQKKVSIGFFDNVELLSDIRDSLLENNLTIFENLACPEGFDPHQIYEDRIYYAFKFVFAPFSDETSMGDSLKSMEPRRKINLADLVIYDSSVKEISDRCSKKYVISLSQNWSPADKIPIVPNITRPRLVEDGKKLSFFDHFGTHLAVPAHFDKSGGKIDVTNLPEELDRPVCLKVDIPFGDKPNFSISKQNLIDWEKSSGVKIPEGSMVLLVTGFGAKNWQKADEYQRNYPGLSIECARWLVEERKVAAIGIDSLLFDDYSLSSKMKFSTLGYLSSMNVTGIENIGGPGLDRMTSDGTGICALSYLRIEGGGGSPVAIYALLPEEPKAPKPVGRGAKKGEAAIASQSPIAQLLSIVLALALFPGRI